MPTPTPHLRAIGYAIAGYTLWVGVDTLMKMAGEATLPSYQTVAFLGLFSAFFMVVFAAPRGEVAALWPKNPRAQLVRAFLAVACNFFNTVALAHLPLTLFYVTVFTAPMMIALLAALCLKEHLTWPKIAAVVIGFGGVVVAINPFGAAMQGDAIGYLAAMASTLCFAVNTVWLRVMTQSESVGSLVFFTGLVEGIVGLGLMLFLPTLPIGWVLLAILAGMGLCNAAGNWLNFLALRLTVAANVAQFHYTQIVAGAAIGYLIWHEIPAAHTMIGAVAIIGSGIYIASRANKGD